MTTIELPAVTYTADFEPRTLTLTGYENRLIQFAAEHRDEFVRAGVSYGPSKLKRMAYRLCQDQARWLDEDLWKVFNLPDPTAETAIRNVMHHHHLRPRHVPFDAADEEEYAS